MSDVSQFGCNLLIPEARFRIGQVVTLRLTEADHDVPSIVRWVRDGEAGLEFFRPLATSLVDRLATPD